MDMDRSPSHRAMKSLYLLCCTQSARAGEGALPGPLQVKQEELVPCSHDSSSKALGLVGRLREMGSEEAVPGGCWLAGKIPWEFMVTYSEYQKVKVPFHREVDQWKGKT